MTSPLEHENRLMRYVLGQMPDEERALIDERLCNEDGFEDELEATIDDVLHAYLAGALSAGDRAAVEGHLLRSSDHRERLAFLKALTGAAQETPPVQSRTWEWLPLAAVLLLALAAGLILLLRGGSPVPPERRVVEVSPPVPSPPVPSPAQLESPRPRTPSPAPPETRVLRLPAKAVAPVNVALGKATRRVRLVVPMPEDRPSFSAVLRDPDGRQIWRADGLAREAAQDDLEVAVPAAVLTAQDYTLSIESDSLREVGAPSQVKREYRLQIRRER
jgi:hypothetical protein